MKLSQAILPVAGLGTRFLPWTKVVPKELLPIGRVPIIALLVDEALSVGVKEICFVISEGKEAIPEYFTGHPELEKQLAARGKSEMLRELSKYDEVQFHTVYQREMRGDGHAILQAASWVHSPTVAVLFGDDLIVGAKNGLQQLASAWEKLDDPTAAVLAVQNVPKERVSKYGIIDIDLQASTGRLKRVKGLVEKPKPDKAPSTLGIVGKYLIPRSTLDVLPKAVGSHGGEIRLIDALMAQLKEIPIYGYEFEGKRYDTGTPEGYKEAVKDLG
ncbi:NTP transferase domain-containing protein [Candidatus Peregrinibacteria bacterium]|nr:NTP transferase domain-containing protein [Candidatus Peregrinibacteria bacterium]